MLRFLYGLTVTGPRVSFFGLLNGVGVKILGLFRHMQALAPVMSCLLLLLVFFGVTASNWGQRVGISFVFSRA